MSLHTDLRYLATLAQSNATQTAVADAIQYINKGPVYEDLFFEKVSDPSWLRVLHENLQLIKIPEVQHLDNGHSKHPPSPALNALGRFASQAPMLVAEILASLIPTPNLTVNSQLLRLISQLPSDSSIQLKGLIQTLIQVPRSGTQYWVNDILCKWMASGHHEQVFDILIVVFNPEFPGDFLEQTHTLDELDRNIFAPLGEFKPIELSCFLSEILTKRHQHTTKGPTAFLARETPVLDSFWLDSFEDESTTLYEYEAILCRRLFRVGVFVFSQCSEDHINTIDKMLRSQPGTLFERLRWQIYSKVPNSSLEFARTDLKLLSETGTLWERPFLFELASMLEQMAKHHGTSFLSTAELEAYVLKAKDVGDLVAIDEPQKRVDSLILQRLHPIRSLLNGANLELYTRLAQELRPLELEDYKPFRTRGGTVQEVAPDQANAMASMRDPELWEFLNTWQPGPRSFSGDDWLKEESPRALGMRFAELIDAQPERFRPESAWWRNLTRPECLSQPLELAAHRIAKKPEASASSSDSPPTAQDWHNWFGLAQWIAESAPATIPDSSEEGWPRWAWNWPCMQTISFLKTAVNEPKFEPPPDFKKAIGPLLARFAEMPDPHLVETTRNWLVDWLTTAINSMRGTAVEGLIELAIQQKAKSDSRLPEPWIFDTLERVLKVPNQSPAIFGLMGARVNLLWYLFDEELKAREGATLLLPPDSFEYQSAFVTAHYRYSSAFPQLLTIIPNLPQIALDVLEQFESEAKPPGERGQGFAHRLGVHLAYYFWNSAYRTDDEGWAALDCFFQVAKPSSREKTFTEIGRLFSPIPFNDEQKDLFDRAMAIWDRRVGQILDTNDRSEFHDELGAFAEWFGADCFPFDWRYQHFTQVFEVLPETPKMFRFMETLRKVTMEQGYLTQGLQILKQVIAKAHFPEFGWNIRDDELKVILRAGLQAGDPQTHQTAEEVRELLLRHRCFEYLDL